MAFDAHGSADRQVGTPTHRLTLDDLPPPQTTRWVMRRKALVVEGVHQGLLTLHDACVRYNLSEEEFLSWERLIQTHGPRALRVTRLQDYRHRSGGGQGNRGQENHGKRPGRGS